MNINFDLVDIQKLIPEARLKGRLTGKLKGLAALSDAKEGDIAFLSNTKYTSQVPQCNASLILLPQDYSGEPKEGQLYMYIDKPSWALAKICRYIEDQLSPRPAPGIHPTAFIDKSAKIDPSVSIGPFAYIGAGSILGPRVVIDSHVHIGKEVSIGEDTCIMPHVTVHDYCKVGKRVRLHAKVVIGSDGFGFSTLKDGTHHREPQIGTVILEDDVDIGAGTTIDKARFSVTQIGEGTKIDNLVQIGHNAQIGKHCLIVAQVGISGSTVVEDNVIIGGHSGIAGHLRIGKGVMIGAMSGVSKDLEPGSYVRGIPVLPYMLAQRIDVLKKRLPELFKRVDNLEKQIEAEAELKGTN
ncbi:MAG: UDP-3-O-(3-hydroxymyristoyl)glucosamine N-acyltransferase [Verrucomicrobia bacterium]|nr:MAG: UDP-3-O-(3-hydroxymyristoyl)glucosamine N-acyltransferase [Verrucomicrobiota bacterium]